MHYMSDREWRDIWEYSDAKDWLKISWENFMAAVWALLASLSKLVGGQ